MAVLTPTTRPAESSSGPPELPGLMAASVWMAPPNAAPQLALDLPAQAADHACSTTACCSACVESGASCSRLISTQYCT